MPPEQRGFTLVEVLVALVVTSLTIAIVMNAALQAKTRSVASLEKDQAVLLARSLIAGRAATRFDPSPRAGEEGGLRWTISERPLATEPGGRFFLVRIDVHVRNERDVALAALNARKLKSAPGS